MQPLSSSNANIQWYSVGQITGVSFVYQLPSCIRCLFNGRLLLCWSSNQREFEWAWDIYDTNSSQWPNGHSIWQWNLLSIPCNSMQFQHWSSLRDDFPIILSVTRLNSWKPLPRSKARIAAGDGCAVALLSRTAKHVPLHQCCAQICHVSMVFKGPWNRPV